MNGSAWLTNPAILKDEIIIPMKNGTMMEWRYRGEGGLSGQQGVFFPWLEYITWSMIVR
jgi:hypothetical protein